MIVISLVLFLLGVGLLAAGLVVESIQLELSAVASALLSGLALYLGVRNRRPVAGQDEPTDPRKAQLTEPLSGLNADDIWSPPPNDRPGPAAPDPLSGDDAAHAAGRTDFDTRGETAQGAEQSGEPADAQDAAEESSLDDEPDEEDTSAANVARVAARSDDVLVIDGRPRYHRQACSALVGQDTVPIPVSEARESGFSPCARCGPDAHLLGSLQRPTRR